MIRSFKDTEAEKIFNGYFSKKLPENIQRKAEMRLIYIHFSKDVNDLRVPPGNRLEILKGNREGQYSIRINDQWRICFRWEDGNAYNVEIVDYH
ncbi:MAG: type II toxin-antitoxin system RelE/ParE family toxin [Syntrophobacteraceae bacterium]